MRQAEKTRRYLRSLIETRKTNTTHLSQISGIDVADLDAAIYSKGHPAIVFHNTIVQELQIKTPDLERLLRVSVKWPSNKHQ